MPSERALKTNQINEKKTIEFSKRHNKTQSHIKFADDDDNKRIIIHANSIIFLFFS